MLQISFNLWDLCVWFCLKGFNKVTQDKVFISMFWNTSQYSCSCNCYWIWVKGMHVSLHDNWIKINWQLLFWSLSHDLKGNWSFNYEHLFHVYTHGRLGKVESCLLGFFPPWKENNLIFLSGLAKDGTLCKHFHKG